jgi:hypothetical protein
LRLTAISARGGLSRKTSLQSAAENDLPPISFGAFPRRTSPDDRAHARAGHAGDRNPHLLQDLEHADVRDAARAAARERKPIRGDVTGTGGAASAARTVAPESAVSRRSQRQGDARRFSM